MFATQENLASQDQTKNITVGLPSSLCMIKHFSKHRLFHVIRQRKLIAITYSQRTY